MTDTPTFAPGWFAKTIADAQARIVAHPLPGRGEHEDISLFEDDALLVGIKILKTRLRILEGEAHRRGLLP